MSTTNSNINVSKRNLPLNHQMPMQTLNLCADRFLNAIDHTPMATRKGRKVKVATPKAIQFLKNELPSNKSKSYPALTGVNSTIDEIETLRRFHNPEDESHQNKIGTCIYCVILEYYNKQPSKFIRIKVE